MSDAHDNNVKNKQIIMNKELLLNEIYGLLLKQKEEKTLTINALCIKLKCSKKSIYKLFSSKKELLVQVYELYMRHLKNLLKDVSMLNNTPSQRLVFQIRLFHQNAQVFFNSHLYHQLASIEGLSERITESERLLNQIAFNNVISEMDMSKENRNKLNHILAFIMVSTKARYLSPDKKTSMSDEEFQDVIVTLLLAFLHRVRTQEDKPPYHQGIYPREASINNLKGHHNG